MFLNIKKNIITKSHYARQLETVEALERLLDQVKGFKAMSKFMELVEDKVDPKTSGGWKTKSKGAWRCYTRAPSYKREGHAAVFYFAPFQNEKDGNGYGSEIELELAAKDIPSLIEALAKFKAKRIEWVQTELEQTEIYTGKIESEVLERLNRPQLAAQFDKMRGQYITYFRELVAELEAL